MNSRLLFIIVLSLFLFFFSADFTQAVTDSAFLNNFQCIRQGTYKDCPTFISLWDFNTQAWQAKIDNTSYQGFGSAGYVRVDICLDGDTVMWNSPASCWTVAAFNYGEQALPNVADTSIKSLDNQDTTTGFSYVTLNVHVEDASTNTFATGYSRKVSIDSFTAEPSSVQVGQPITVNWSTDSAVKGVTLFWDGAVGTGSEPEINSDTKTFTPTSAGTAFFTLRACGPIGFPGGCISQERQVTVTQPAAVSVILQCEYPPGSGAINNDSCNISNDSSATLIWTVTNATSCTASNGWSGPKDSSDGAHSESTGNLRTSDSPKTYFLSCTNSTSGATDTVTINITGGGGPAPEADIRCNGSSGSCTISSGQSATITWCGSSGSACNNAVSCEVRRSDGVLLWTGTSGNKSTGPLTSSVSGTLTCLNSAGVSNSSTVTVNISGPPPPPPPEALTCSPTNQTVSVGTTANFSASGGSGNYTWRADDGNPSSGTGANFYTVFPKADAETVRVTSGGVTAECFVTVTSGPPPPPPPPSGPNLEICVSGQTPSFNCGDSFNVVKGNVIQLKAWYDSDGNGQGWEDVTIQWQAGIPTGWTLCNESKNSDLRTYKGVQSCQGVRFEPTSQGSPPYIAGAYRGEVNNVGDSAGVVNANLSGTSDQIGIVVFIPDPPVVSNVIVTEPNYCLSGPAATTGWTYSDSGGSSQSAYQVQVDTQGSSFNPPIIDSGKISCSGCRSYSTPQGILQFNTTYKARVRAWNSSDLVSSWVDSSSWKTPSFAYPQVGFIFAPVAPGQTQIIPNDPVQFTDQTVFYDGNPNGRRWSWLFGDGGSATSQNPRHTYIQPNTYNATLTATDNANQSCSITKPVNVQLPNPIWKEVNPGG